MRKGQNPLKYRPIPELPKVVAAVITHLPNQEGYHAERLEIIQLSLSSLREHADVHLLVWDNGSCDALREWLLEFKPDQLVLSNNVGKSSALTAIVRMFPRETVIAYGDDDILYSPYWLESQLELLDRYPPAVVSGYPVRPLFAKHLDHTLSWGAANADMQTGRFISDEWMRDYAASLGLDPAKAQNWDDPDHRLNFNGMMAYAGSQHCQFVARVDDLEPLVSWDSYGSADESKLDERIDSAGLLRLTTISRYARHMGNVPDDEIRAVIGRYEGLRF